MNAPTCPHGPCLRTKISRAGDTYSASVSNFIEAASITAVTFMKGLLVLLLVTSITMVSAQTTLKIGDKAPAFTGKDQDGKSVALSSFAGKKVVLYFYPKDQTPGCTAQACNLRDNIDMLTQQGYVVLGVSTDDEASHRAFREKYNLPFTLIADTDKSITQAYGVWVEKEREGKKERVAQAPTSPYGKVQRAAQHQAHKDQRKRRREGKRRAHQQKGNRLLTGGVERV